MTQKYFEGEIQKIVSGIRRRKNGKESLEPTNFILNSTIAFLSRTFQLEERLVTESQLLRLFSTLTTSLKCIVKHDLSIFSMLNEN